MTERAMTPEEIANQIRLGMLQSYDVFSEAWKLCRFIHQGLLQAEVGAQAWLSKGSYLLPKEKASGGPANRFMRTDMGFAATIDANEESVSEGDEEDEGAVMEEAEDEAIEEAADDKKTVSVRPDTRLLGVRVVLFDPRDQAIGPTLFVGVFGALTLTPASGRAARVPQASFRLQRMALKRLVKGLGPETQAGVTVSKRLTRKWLSGEVVHFLPQPIAAFTSKADVDGFVAKIVDVL